MLESLVEVVVYVVCCAILHADERASIAVLTKKLPCVIKYVEEIY